MRPKLWTIVGAGILARLAITIGLILLIVPGLFLLTIWCLIVPVIVLEGAGRGDSFGRSRELVRGNGWNVFGLIVLTFLILCRGRDPVRDRLRVAAGLARQLPRRA